MEQRSDVVVVGAGAVGLSCAWRAAQRGLRVLCLDREQPGAGASGVAAGMLAPVTEAEWGEEALLALNLRGAASWPSFHDELTEASGLDAGFRASGALVVAADRDDAEELRRLHVYQRGLDLAAEWLGPRQARRLEPGLSPRIAGAILAPDDHQTDPSAAVRALARAVERAGGRIAGGAEVVAVDSEGGRVSGVRTRDGRRFPAEQVVIAAGAWSGRIEGVGAGGPPPVRPVKGQILSLRRRGGAPPLAERLIRTPRCYVVDRGDGRVVVGATVEERGFDREVTAEGVFRLLEAAREVLPDVDELGWVGARAGLRPGSADNAPIIGFGALTGLVWATGHHRNGLLLAPLTGELVAGLLSGGEPGPELAPFAPARFAPTRDDAAPGEEAGPAALHEADPAREAAAPALLGGAA